MQVIPVFRFVPELFCNVSGVVLYKRLTCVRNNPRIFRMAVKFLYYCSMKPEEMPALRKRKVKPMPANTNLNRSEIFLIYQGSELRICVSSYVAAHAAMIVYTHNRKPFKVHSYSQFNRILQTSPVYQIHFKSGDPVSVYRVPLVDRVDANLPSYLGKTLTAFSAAF